MGLLRALVVTLGVLLDAGKIPRYGNKLEVTKREKQINYFRSSSALLLPLMSATKEQSSV